LSILDKFSPFVKCFTSLLVYLSNIPLLRENPAKVNRSCESQISCDVKELGLGCRSC